VEGGMTNHFKRKLSEQELVNRRQAQEIKELRQEIDEMYHDKRSRSSPASASISILDQMLPTSHAPSVPVVTDPKSAEFQIVVQVVCSLSESSMPTEWIERVEEFLFRQDRNSIARLDVEDYVRRILLWYLSSTLRSDLSHHSTASFPSSSSSSSSLSSPSPGSISWSPSSSAPLSLRTSGRSTPFTSVDAGLHVLETAIQRSQGGEEPDQDEAPDTTQDEPDLTEQDEAPPDTTQDDSPPVEPEPVVEARQPTTRNQRRKSARKNKGKSNLFPK